MRISSGVGLFCGGRHLTALMIIAPCNCSVSSGLASKVPVANPYLVSVSYSNTPAKSPVNGRPVRFAPCLPGANPMMPSHAAGSPNAFTGAFHQVGNSSRNSWRKATRRGQSGQSCGGSESAIGLGAKFMKSR